MNHSAGALAGHSNLILTTQAKPIKQSELMLANNNAHYIIRKKRGSSKNSFMDSFCHLLMLYRNKYGF